ncbi:unnamed protein product [Clonostachys rosea]|uniref:Xylanolytic transcriptional activator regulatory domain-containing protein n=1 Tax=Bionectria ochroleuca TaxID=29856 RepID=A0ABY6U8B9_BIOOC|nr:unnamed protein product [Clonostachys rosea]
MAEPTSFIDSIGHDEFAFLWNDDFTPGDQPLPLDFFDTGQSLVDVSHQYSAASRTQRAPIDDTAPNARPVIDSAPDTMPFLSAAASIPSRDPSALAMRFPSLEPETKPADPEADTPSTGYRPLSAVEHNRPYVCPWRISCQDYQQLSHDLSAFSELLPPGFQCPSRPTLSRYLEGYFRGYHDHLPFLHTTSSTTCLGIELVISLAAVGALYRFEHAKGYQLYRVAKAIVNKRFDEWNEEATANLSGSAGAGYAGFASSLPDGQPSLVTSPQKQHPSKAIRGQCGLSGLRLLQSLIVLMSLTSWSDRGLMRDALSIASQIAMVVRELGISQPEDEPRWDISWDVWMQVEERRRTLFVAYVVLNLQCMAFNVPPLLLNQDISINLPCCASIWRAVSAKEWAGTVHLSAHPGNKPFQLGLQEMYLGKVQGRFSAFGNYIMIHALFQQIFFARNANALHPNALDPDFTRRIEVALRAWQESWEASYDSTLDPSSPKGPIGFNSTAVLRLVYIRINVNTGPKRQLITSNPEEIASAFAESQIQIGNRSPHLDRAVLQCIHALSVPVRVGVAFVARTQTFSWSIQHALSNLECALLLTHWLRSIAQSVEVSGPESLRSDERKLLDMAVSLILETELADAIENMQYDGVGIRQLAASTMRIWAETFKGFQVFEIVHRIGLGLCLVADMLGREIGGSA